MNGTLSRRQFVSSVAGGFAISAFLPDVSGNIAVAADAKARLTLGLRSAGQSIAWIGIQAGMFTKHGIDMTLDKFEVGGPEVAKGLNRGDWEFGSTGTTPIAESFLTGGDAVILLKNYNPHEAVLVMTRRDITNLGQLAGKRIGVLTDAISGQTGINTRLAIEKAGATATYVGLGSYPNIYAALGRGEIDGGALPIDYRFLGKNEFGLNSFERGGALGVSSVFATTRKLIAADRGQALRAVRAMLETIHLFKTKPDVVAPLLQKFLGFGDLVAVEQLRAFYAPLFPAVPRWSSEDDLAAVRRQFVGRYPAAANMQESSLVDSSIIGEVENSGFVRQLYGGDPPR